MTSATLNYATQQRLRSLRVPRVCLAVTGTDPAQLIDKAESFVRDNQFLEFRLDYLPRPALALPKIRQFFELYPHVAAIATCRRKANGGRFTGSIGSQLEVPEKAA